MNEVERDYFRMELQKEINTLKTKFGGESQFLLGLASELRQEAGRILSKANPDGNR